MSPRPEKDQEWDDRVRAEIQVEAFVDILSTRYGINMDDVPKYLDAIRWVIEHRTNMSRVLWTVALGILGIAITGAISAIWEGVKHAIRN